MKNLILFNYFILYLNKKVMNDRRNFLKTACKPFVLAAFGIPLIEACATEEEQPEVDSNSTVNNPANEGNTAKKLEINLDDNRFSDLQEIGGWVNFKDENILLVRISEDEIRVFDNACPHQGARDFWSFDGNNFTCSNHGNSFGANCNGSLTCYEASLEGNILTINF